MNFNRPRARSNQACAPHGYRYEFHIGKGTSPDAMVYRVEFKNTLHPRRRRLPTIPGGGVSALADHGGTETMRVTRLRGRGVEMTTRTPARRRHPGRISPSSRNNHGPQTDRLSTPRLPGTTSGDPTSREVGCTISVSSTPSSTISETAGVVIAGQFDDPYQLDGDLDLVNLNRDARRTRRARRPPGKGRPHRPTSSRSP
jgi:hypothetical protein